MGHPGLFLYLSFQTNITIFTTKICEKMSIQYIALGFEPQPSEYESPTINTRPGLAPALTMSYC